MARQADGTLLVLQQGETRRREVRLSKRRLAGVRVLGAVLNGVQSSRPELRREEIELPPEMTRELESGEELVAIVEQELFVDGKTGERR